jgi:redox-sensitive bicupin YhaK (pirin superfamily)
VLPSKAGMTPRYGQKDFTLDDRRGHWLAVANGVEGRDAPIEINQSASFFVARLESGSATYAFAPGRLGFLFVADGDVKANDQELHTGDAVRMAGIERLEVIGSGELLLWDLAPAP